MENLWLNDLAARNGAAHRCALGDLIAGITNKADIAIIDTKE